MSISVEINGNDITTEIDAPSFRLESNISSKVDMLSFTYRKTPSKTYVPENGDEVIVSHGTERVFGGYIVEYSQELEVGSIILYRVTVKDYTDLLDRRLVANVYKDGESGIADVSDIVKAICATYAPDITTTDYVVDTGLTIEQAAFDYVRPSDAIRDLADYVNFDWYVDAHKKMHFAPRGADHAPFDLADTNNSYDGRSLVLNKSTKQIKNVIYVIGGDYIGQETSDKIGKGDGVQKRFRLPYKYDSLPTVTVNGVAQTVGVEFLDTTGFDCYWNQNEKTLTFTNAPADTHAINVSGKPLIPLLVKMSSPNDARGAYEYKIVDKTLKTTDAVRRRAQAELDAYAEEIEEGSFTTIRSGLKAGQRIYVNSVIRGLTAERYVIQQVVMRMKTPTEFKYSVKLANVKAFEVIEFMRMLLRQGDKSSGVVGNPSVVLNTIVSFGERVGVQENYNINTYRKTLIEQVGVRETVKARKNFMHTWVYGEYLPTGIDDPKRVPMWDRGALYL